MAHNFSSHHRNVDVLLHGRVLTSAPQLISILVRLASVINTSAARARKLKALDRVSLSARGHVALLEQPGNDLLHVVQIISPFDLRVLIVVTRTVKPANRFPIG